MLASTLGGAAIGSAVGGRAGHLTELGIPEERAERYHSAIESGHVVVAIIAPDATTVETAQEVLTINGAEELDVHPYTGRQTRRERIVLSRSPGGATGPTRVVDNECRYCKSRPRLSTACQCSWSIC